MTASIGIDLIKELGVRSQGRNPQWSIQTAYTGAPESATAGIDVREGIVSLVSIGMRENPARYRSRVTVTGVDDTATYTVRVGDDTNEMTFTYAASASDTAVEILTGLRDAINAGVVLTTGNLTYVDANPDTIERASGSNLTDGVIIGTQLTIVGGTNPGTYTVAAVTSSTVVTLVASDALTGGGPEAVTSVTAFQPVVATIRDSNGDGTIDTLVIERRDVDTTIDAESVTFSTTVTATGTGVLAAEEDAGSASLRMWMLPEITTDDATANMPLGRMPWTEVNNADAYTLDYRGFIERFESSGASRFYAELSTLTGVTSLAQGASVTALVGIAPGILEP